MSGATQPTPRRIAGSIAVALLATLYGWLTFRLIEGSGEQLSFAAMAPSGLIFGYVCWPNVECA